MLRPLVVGSLTKHYSDVLFLFFSLLAGHYTAFATNNKAWFNFKDCSVKETDFQNVNSCKAYILFYVQRDF